MKNVHCFLILFTLIVSQRALTQEKADKPKSGTLLVEITGLENHKGDIRIGLFDSEESFNGKAEKFRGDIIEADKDTIVWEVRDIPFGYYAIKTFHDEDQDDEIDTNFGIPSEGFGFSNNPSILFGPPGFKAVRFLFDKDNMKIEIKLINL